MFGALIALIFLLSFISLGEKQINLSSLFNASEMPSPGDWIKENQIKVYKDRVVLEIDNPAWANFTDTNSMDPFLDEDSNTIEIKPEAPEQVNPGDIISYQTGEGIIIHRVVERGEDKEGLYYLVKGDNNSSQDPFKVRFKDIKGVVVAVIY